MLLKLSLHLLFLSIVSIFVESVNELHNCTWAVERIQQRENATKCNIEGRTPKVCCPKNRVTRNVLETTFEHAEPKPSATGRIGSGNSLPPTTTGQLSQMKCDEYYPREYPLKGSSIIGAGGEYSKKKEFPHMALLGYGDDNDVKWKCGGSLISLQHILTAAHCLHSQDFGYVKFVRLGDLDISTDTDDARPQNFNVKSIISHPDYESGTVKNDIAILVLDRPANFTDYVQPACLYLGVEMQYKPFLTATGWGITEFGGKISSKLIKLKLKPVNHGDCLEQYKKTGSKGAINSTTQICAGSATEGKIVDTCEGDSGGPLQFQNYTENFHYRIIGVTSFGKACGITNSPGVYTRVSYYIPWIESIAFKN